MPSLNFTVFVDKVENGTKRQTIRPMRKRPICVGDRLYHYTGQRTKKCRKLGESVCTETIPVIRERRYLWIISMGGKAPLICARGFLEQIAHLDGFDSLDDFEDFFDRYPDGTELQVIRWQEMEKP